MEYFNSILGIFRLDFRISEWISGFQSGFLDFRVDIWISDWISADSVQNFFRGGPLGPYPGRVKADELVHTIQSQVVKISEFYELSRTHLPQLHHKTAQGMSSLIKDF